MVIGARAVLLVLLLTLPWPALAQERAVAARIRAAAAEAGDLQFPSAPSTLSATNPTMGLYKPPGGGPFPAIVLAPHCSGLGVISRFPNLSIGRWAREMIERGYVVLLIDSQGARGVDTNCYEPKGHVYHVRGALDVLQAAEHLRAFDFVDKKRIAAVGFSWGGMVDLLAASKLYQSAFRIDEGFAAFVAVYPACFTFVTPQGLPYEIVLRDIDRPGLVLMGGEDHEAPAAQCVSKLQGAEWSGAPVEWQVFPHATHCWDCAHLDGYSKTDFRGNRVTHRFDGDVTAATKRRMFEFLDRVLEKQK